MCGVVGAAGKIDLSERKMFRDMLVFDQVRGFDSTGVFGVEAYPLAGPKNSPDYLVKDIGPAQNLWEYGPNGIFNARGVPTVTPKLLMGHNRAATIGEVTVDNAHPFEYGSIVGAHNGSLTVWKDLVGAQNVDVDSKALINHISKKGIQHCWKSFWGAAAVTFWDRKTDVMSFIRNEERPLFLVWSEKKDALFWASELWMITVAAQRNNVALERNEKNKVLYIEPKPHHLYQFEVYPAAVKTMEVKELEKKSYQHSKVGKSTPRIGFTSAKSGGYTISDFIFPWKSKTRKCKLDLDQVELTSFRLVVGVRNAFRFTVNTKIGMVGTLDVVPSDQAAFKQLSRALDIISKGEKVKATLKSRPRVEDLNYLPHIQKFYCSSSAIKIELPPEEDVKGDEENKHYLAPDNSFVSKEKFESLLKATGGRCGYCDAGLTAEDHKTVRWLTKDAVLCGECNNNWGKDVHYLNSGVA